MSSTEPTVSPRQARALITQLATHDSVLLLSPPGMGKSDLVMQAARDAGLPCRSLLGTQIAPEDVSGVPRIVGDRSVFCPPRMLLPEREEPFCLFLDELPACQPDVQKAFYSLLLERRIGEHPLPRGSWVVAAGNRVQDRALVRSLSSALVNRVTILNLRLDVPEWLAWARGSHVRSDIISFIHFLPAALMRPVPDTASPFSTPRSWTALSRALDRVEAAGPLDGEIRRALAFGRVSAEDAAIYCAMSESGLHGQRPAVEYLRSPSELPPDLSARWFIFTQLRHLARAGALSDHRGPRVDAFLRALPLEHRVATVVGLVDVWAELGASPALLATLAELTGA